MTLGDRDPALRRFERDAVVACGVMAAIALAWQRGHPDGAASVLAGGMLMAVSYGAIKGGVDVLVQVAAASTEACPTGPEACPIGPRRRAALVVKFLARYALLAVGAYVMLTCFRLHPAGLLAGATTPFVAAAVQIVRLSRAPSRREHP